jgi:hypothetical protein
MKIAVIGSRGLIVCDLENYLPEETTEIVSGGARGIDTCARFFAHKNGLKITEFLPDYEKYGKIAPLMRNLEIIDYSDEVYAFWDGASRGTKFVIENCRRKKKKLHIFMLKNPEYGDF